MNYNLYPFKAQPLLYAYDALEPFIDRMTMEYHHDKHYQGYIDKLNYLLKGMPGLQRLSIEQLLFYDNNIPAQHRTAVLNNAGGAYNHMFFFNGMTDKPSMFIGNLMNAILRDFKSYDAFKSQFKEQALSVFGSGYTWLIVVGNKLRIVNTLNQETPIKMGCPIFALDMWEHAYYLKHQNRRENYIDDFFNVLNLKKAEENYNNCINYL